MHAELKITLSVIALLHTFSDNHARIVISIGCVWHTGMVLLRKEDWRYDLKPTHEVPVCYTVPLELPSLVASLLDDYDIALL